MARVQQVSGPNAVRRPVILEVNGQRVEVGPEFNSLSPEEQQNTVNEIAGILGQNQQAQQPAAPDPNRIVSTGSRVDQMTTPTGRFGQRAIEGFTGMAQGAGHVLDNAAELATPLYNATLGRIFGQTDTRGINEAGGGFEGLANRIGPGSEGGRTLGEIGAATMLTRGLPGGAFGQGAGAGAVLSDNEGLGFGADVLASGAGGYLLDRGVRLAGNLIAPVVSDAARRLHDRGIHITPGQAVERVRRFEERRTSRPFLGDQIVQGRQQGYRDFNRVALEDVAAPVNRVEQARGGAGIAIPQNLGNDAVRQLGDQISARYERLIPRLSMRPDTELANDITGIAANTTNGDLSPAALEQFNTIIANQVTPHLAGSAPITGEAFRQIERRLGNQIRRFGNSSEPDNQAMADAFREMQQAFQRALARSNPAHSEELGALNESWSNLVRVEDAAGRMAGGLFTPGQFRQAVRRADTSTRHRAMARGEARMGQLADDAADVLPNEYPDSGTAGRNQESPFDPRFWLGLLQSRAYTPEAQARITNLLMAPRPPGAQTIADLLRLIPAPQAGAAGAQAISGPFLGPVP